MDIKIGIMDRLPGMSYRCSYKPPYFPFEFVSEACTDLTGYTSQELAKKGLADIIRADESDKMENLYRSTLAIGLPLEVSFWITTKTGEHKRVFSRCRIVETDNVGMPHIIEGLLIDVTKLIQTEVAFVENRDNSDFWEKIGYGIRSPMNAILGLSDLGLREDMPEEVRKYTQIIGESGRKLMRAITDIMDYKRIERGELTLTSKAYDFKSLVDDAVHFARENSELEIKVSVDRDLPAVLVGDEEKIRQILVHLLSNAVKFTDDGFVSISVESKTFDEIVNLKITVEDMGRGIEEEDKENIFAPFTQFDNKTIEGAGLGLTLTKGMVEKMGGKISFTSQVGAGSIFTVELSQGVCEDSCGVKKSHRAFTQTAFVAPDARILVVDDVSANLTVAEGFLRPYKVQIEFCMSGEEAIAKVKNTRYDLILMDYLMPKMTGAETAAAIREIPTCKTIPIIALTANTENSEHFSKSGMDGYLAKPIDAGELNEILETWIPDEKQREISPDEPAPVMADLSKLKIAGIDVSRGVAKMGGNADTYLRVIKEYFKNGAGLAKNLRMYAEQGDLKTYHVYAHALNSISENIGANEISKDAAALEKAAERGELSYVRVNNALFVAKLLEILNNINEAIKDMEILPVASVKTNKIKRKILLIDDTPSYLLFLSDILKDDFEPLTSINAQDGIHTARMAKPDLILLDIMMPGMSGYEALEIFKSDDDLKHIPVILVSGKEQKENEAKGLSLGAAGYVKKPFDTSAVKKKVKEVLA
ncbi:MAG: response regulator [Defluviitaleaceae bacterium]|nr:response regulator [Defluviitaleaceae bacterium]